MLSHCVLHAHTRAISDVSWHHMDAHMLATASVENCLYLWDVREPRRPMSSLPATSGASQVKWNKKDSHLLASGHDTDMRIWDSRKPDRPMLYLAGHMDKVNSIDWSPHDQAEIVSASLDCSVRFFDITSPRRPHTTITTTHPVWRAKYTPFGRGVVSQLVPRLVRGDNGLLLWAQHQTHAPLHCFVGHTDAVINFQWRRQRQQDGSECQLVSWGRDRALRIWRLDADMQSLCGEASDGGADEAVDADDEELQTLNLLAKDGETPDDAGAGTLMPASSIKQEQEDDEAVSDGAVTRGEEELLAEGAVIKTEPSLELLYLEPRVQGNARSAFGSTSALLSAGNSVTTQVALLGSRSPPLSSSVPHESSFSLPSSDAPSQRVALRDELAALQSQPWGTNPAVDVNITARDETKICSSPTYRRPATHFPSHLLNASPRNLRNVAGSPRLLGNSPSYLRLGSASSPRRSLVPMSPSSAAVASILASPYRVPAHNYCIDDDFPFGSSPANSPRRNSKERTPNRTNAAAVSEILTSGYKKSHDRMQDATLEPQNDAEKLLLPSVSDDASENLQNCVRFITLADEVSGTKQVLVQSEDGILRTIDTEDDQAAALLATSGDELMTTDESDVILATENGDNLLGPSEDDDNEDDLLATNASDATQVVVGQDGTVYAINGLDEHDDFDPSLILQDSQYEVELAQTKSVEMTHQTYIDEAGVERSKICFMVTTGIVAPYRLREPETRNYELLCQQLGIVLGSPRQEPSDIPKKKTVHVDESCLDYGGSVFHSQELGESLDVDCKEPLPEVEIDKTLKKVLVPLENNGFMRVYGRRTSVDEKIVKRFPIPNYDLCRALAPPLLKHLIMNVGINVLIFGTKFFMATVDLVVVENELKIDLGLSEPEQHISEMRELSYNFVEILGWESPELYKAKMRTMAIIDKNPLNLHQCSSCKKSYKTTTTLVSHMAKCRIRAEGISHPADDDAGSAEDEETRIYTCRYCDQMCYSMAALNLHIMEQHPRAIEEKIQIKVNVQDGMTRCFVCNGEFNSTSLPGHLIEKHFIKIVKGDVLKCLECDVFCKNAVAMMAHKPCHQNKDSITAGKREELPQKPQVTTNKSSSPTKPRYKCRKPKDASHRCGICDALFASRRQIVQHLITHTNLRPFKCTLCGENFTFRRTLIRHCNESHPEVCTQPCKFCGLPFETVSELKRHSCNASQKGGFPCPYCDFETNMDIRLFVHIHSHGRGTRYFCVYCSNFFPTVNKVRYHQRSFHPIEARKQEANKRRIKKLEFEMGKSEVDQPLKDEDIVVVRINDEFVYTVDPRLGKPVEKDKSVSCYYCFIRFSTKNAMRRHIQVQHPDKPLYKCTECVIVFKNNAEYLTHRKRYHKPRLLVSQPASPSVNLSTDLIHMEEQVESCKQKLADIGSEMIKLESLNSAFKCDFCMQGFKSELLLELHMEEVHSDSAMFGDNSKAHARKLIHLVYYVCSYDNNCQQRFDDKLLMQQHLSNAHQVFEAFEQNYREEVIAAPNRLGRKPKNFVNLDTVKNERNNSAKNSKKKVASSTNKRYIKCDKCSGTFSSATSLRQHKLGTTGRGCTGARKNTRKYRRKADSSPSISIHTNTSDNNNVEVSSTEAEYRELFIKENEINAFKEDVPPAQTNDFMALEFVKTEVLDDDPDVGSLLAEIQDIKKEIELNENCDVVSSVVKVGACDTQPLGVVAPLSPLAGSPPREYRPAHDTHVTGKKGKLLLNVKGLASQIGRPKKRSKLTSNDFSLKTSIESKQRPLLSDDEFFDFSPRKVSHSTEILKETSVRHQNHSSIDTETLLEAENIPTAKKSLPNKLKNPAAIRKRKLDENADDPEWNPKGKTKKRAFACSACSDKFNTKAELKFHSRYDH
ncbi:uncharacterized protein LOC108673215 [Hyalella azteca]|uniref:Uncharacterized protein LOC108673215 n=1 Tax=Hyalella azteca TaxID=294128 RepID=A0A8B7NS30_HYAAZ|nr:uncharacterized protein LOC108673215 [Hyalella azteca]